MSSPFGAVIDGLEAQIVFEVADKQIPSISYGLFSRDGLLGSGHFGRDGVAPDAASRFRIGSITKTFTALAAMQLVERGLVELDADIRQALPGFAPDNPFDTAPVTLRALLSHRSGLVREAAVGHYLDDRPAALSETVASLARSRLKAQPGTYHYSNAGFATIGAVIEAISQQSYADYLQANLLDPLELRDTMLTMPADLRARLAPAAVWGPEGDWPAPVFELGGAPAGNIYATLNDAVRYGQMLLRGGAAADGERIVAPETFAAMLQPGGETPGKGYGLGLAIDQLDGQATFGHGGVVYGYASTLLLMPDAGLGVVMFVTLDSSNGVIGRLARHGLRLALAARGQGAAPSPLPRRPLPDRALCAALVGEYHNDAGGHVVTISAQGERLYLLEQGVAMEIRPTESGGLTLEGRLHGEGTGHAIADPVVPVPGALVWRGQNWSRVEVRPVAPCSAELAPHLGRYGPAFCPTLLFEQAGELICLIEYFCVHRCEPVGLNRYRMHGALYQDEILQVNARDQAGQAGIRVGEMFLAYLRD